MDTRVIILKIGLWMSDWFVVRKVLPRGLPLFIYLSLEQVLTTLSAISGGNWIYFPKTYGRLALVRCTL